MRWSILALAGSVTIVCCASRFGPPSAIRRSARTIRSIPGELAYSTLDRFARSIIDSGDWGLGLGDSDRDVALKLWLWKITHTLHDYTPKLLDAAARLQPGEVQDPQPEHPIRPDPSHAVRAR